MAADHRATTAETMSNWRRHLSKGRASLGAMFGGQLEVSAHGAEVVTDDGAVYLNCAGYGVFLLGATHPSVTEAVVEQVRRHPVATRILLEPVAARAAAALASITPPGLDKVHFTGSGAEAVETALKIARLQGARRLVSTELGYHGKTMGALTLTRRDVYREPFRPLLPNAEVVPYGDAGALDELLADGEPSVFFVEPVQGEAGVVVPPPGYLAQVAQVCRDRQCLLVVDEVMTGLGRTGSWFAVDQDGVLPDVLLVGKALSGGVVPVAAAVTTPQLYKSLDNDPFLHTSTFSGAPIAMAAAAAAVEALREAEAPARAESLGRELLERLAPLRERYPGLVTDVRGRGLLIAVELADAGLTGEVMLELVERRLLVNHSLNNSRVLRLTPPVVLDAMQVDTIAKVFAESLEAVSRLAPAGGH